MANQTIEIVEVAPRDGLQSEPGAVPLATRVELIERLVAAGLRRIEVASFVNPRKVPQMAGAEQLLAALPSCDGVSFIGLVMNRRGYERAAAAGCREIGMVVSASDTFNRRNQGVGTRESIRVWSEIARSATAAGLRAQVTISAAFGCPFEGEVPLERTLALARDLAQAQPVEIAFADTIGVAVPAQVTELIARARDALAGMPLRGHFHNTRNMGIANACAALAEGVGALDASVGGIGGCPFAPGATGNIATEDLVYLLTRSAIAAAVDIEALIATARWMEVQLGHPVPGALSKAGIFPSGTQPTTPLPTVRS